MTTIYKTTQYTFSMTNGEFEQVEAICEKISGMMHRIKVPGSVVPSISELAVAWLEFDKLTRTDSLSWEDPCAKEQLSDGLLDYFEDGSSDYLDVKFISRNAFIEMVTNREKL